MDGDKRWEWFRYYGGLLLFGWGMCLGLEIVSGGLDRSLPARLVAHWLAWVIVTLTVVASAALNLRSDRMKGRTLGR